VIHRIMLQSAGVHIEKELAQGSITTTGATDQQPSPIVVFYAKQQSELAREADTVACVGATKCGFADATLCAFFSERPGFVTFEATPRMGGGFAKFETPNLAPKACQNQHTGHCLSSWCLGLTASPNLEGHREAN